VTLSSQDEHNNDPADAGQNHQIRVPRLAKIYQCGLGSGAVLYQIAETLALIARASAR
jgi:hypothetical protein